MKLQLNQRLNTHNCYYQLNEGKEKEERVGEAGSICREGEGEV